MATSTDIAVLFDRAPRAKIKLPPAWIAAQKAAEKLAAGYQRARSRSQAHRAGFEQRAQAEALVKRVMAGEDIPDDPTDLAAPVIAVEQADHAADIATSMLVAGRDTAERKLEGMIRTGASGLIVDLAAALAEVVEAVQKLAPEVAGIDPSDARAVLRAPASVQAALKKLDAESVRARSIRACQLSVMSLARRKPGTYTFLREPRRRAEDEDFITALLADVECSPWVPTAEEEAAFERAKDDERRANAPTPRIPSFRWAAANVGD